MSVSHVTDAEFEEKVLNAEGPSWSTSGPTGADPARRIAPALEEIAGEMSDSLSVAKLDVDSNPSTPAKYGIRGIPTLILFKGARWPTPRSARLPKAKLAEWLRGAV